jgi:hypothetical protein
VEGCHVVVRGRCVVCLWLSPVLFSCCCFTGRGNNTAMHVAATCKQTGRAGRRERLLLPAAAAAHLASAAVSPPLKSSTAWAWGRSGRTGALPPAQGRSAQAGGAPRLPAGSAPAAGSGSSPALGGGSASRTWQRFSTRSLQRSGAAAAASVRCGAVRCGAVRCGAVRVGALRCVAWFGHQSIAAGAQPSPFFPSPSPVTP